MAPEPRDPDPDPPPDPADRRPEVVRLAPGPPRWPVAWAVIAIAFVALAVMKPWAWPMFAGVHAPDVSGPFVPQPPVEVVEPSPTADLSPEGLAEPACLGPGSWRIASLERWRTQSVRVWRAIFPVGGASGPTDPRLPTVGAIAFDIPALGWCAPVGVFGAPTEDAAVVDAWVIRNGEAAPIRLTRLQPVDGSTPFGALYAPPPASCLVRACPGRPPQQGTGAVVATSWPTGHFVFHYWNDGTGDLWWAVDVEQVPPIGEETAPPPGPTPQASRPASSP